MKGRDALDQQTAIRGQMTDLVTQARGNLSTAAQTIDFDRQVRYLYSRADREVGMHADQQMQVWGVGVNKAGGDLALNGIVKATQAGDQNAVANHTQDLTNFRMKEAELTYGTDLSPDIRANVIRGSNAEAGRSQVMALLPHDPVGAQKVLDANVQYFNPLEYQALSKRLKQPLIDQQAQHLVFGNGSPQGSIPSGPPVVGATPDEQAHLDNFRHRESSGNYATPHPAAPLSGSASGAYGMIDQTWKEAAAATGVGTQFPHAYQAPPAVQDTNALWLYRNRGSAPWASEGGSMTAPLTQDQQRVPGLMDKLNQINASNADPRVKEAASRLAITTASAQYADQTRDYELHQRAVKDASDTRENQIIGDAMSPMPQITAQQIANDPALTPDARLRMIGVVQSKGSTDIEHADQAYGKGFWNAYKGVTAAPGDPSRITDQSQIVSRAGPGGDLTLAGVQKLNQIMGEMKRPEAAGDNKMQAGALAYAKHHLDFSEDYGVFKTRDPQGEDAFNIGFLPAFFKYWQTGLAAGKSPAELVDKTQMDKLMAPFMGTPAERQRRQLEVGDQTDIVSPGKASAGPPQGAVAYLRSNPQLRGAFDEKYGAGAAEGILGSGVPAAPIVGTTTPP